MTLKEQFCMEEKITVIGPKEETEALKGFLRGEAPQIRIVKNHCHFPYWETTRELHLAVPHGEPLKKTIETIYCQLKTGYVMMGWLDNSSVCYRIERNIQT